eukprot:Opistho-1_new@77419
MLTSCARRRRACSGLVMLAPAVGCAHSASSRSAVVVRAHYTYAPSSCAPVVRRAHSGAQSSTLVRLLAVVVCAPVVVWSSASVRNQRLCHRRICAVIGVIVPPACRRLCVRC